jgi:hypothetical protein
LGCDGVTSISLSIQRAIVEGPDGPVLVPTKTLRSYRVALDTASLELLRAEHEALGAGGHEDRFVFAADPEGRRPWLPNLVTKRFIDARRAAGLEHFRLHDYADTRVMPTFERSSFESLMIPAKMSE